jgi:hypothetical protein
MFHKGFQPCFREPCFESFQVMSKS